MSPQSSEAILERVEFQMFNKTARTALHPHLTAGLLRRARRRPLTGVPLEIDDAESRATERADLLLCGERFLMQSTVELWSAANTISLS